MRRPLSFASRMDALPRSLPQLLRDRARQRPHTPLLVHGERIETYADFDRRTDELAAGLAGLGVGAGDVVALFMTNSPEYLQAWWAVLKVGAAVVHVNPAYTVPEAAYVIDHAHASLAIADEKTVQVLLYARPRLPRLRHVAMAGQNIRAAQAVGLEALCEPGGTPPAVQIAPQALAGLVYTSGTTGAPNGAMLTHGAGTSCPAPSNSAPTFPRPSPARSNTAGSAPTTIIGSGPAPETSPRSSGGGVSGTGGPALTGYGRVHFWAAVALQS